jgi:pimeloyl-ACP methyl ester carboxylesterase
MIVAMMQEEPDARACHTRGWLRFRLPSAALALALSATACEPETAATPACPSLPVIFVHGLDQGPGIFSRMIEHLSGNGYPRACLRAMKLVPANGSNIAAAEQQLAPAIEQALESARASRVHLVGHSMGALSARWYAAVLRPDRVASLVTTSGANHGTNWECAHPFGEGHFEMCPAFARDPERELQVKLNGGDPGSTDETPFGPGADGPGAASVRPDAQRSILYITIRAPGDLYILPNESLLLRGAGDPGLWIPAVPGATETSPGNYLLPGSRGHDELLGERPALELLQRILAARNGQLGEAREGLEKNER